MFSRGRRAWTALIVMLTLGFAAPWAGAAAMANPELAKALAYFERGDYPRVVLDLPPLIASHTLKPDEEGRAREALGVSYYVLGRMLESRREFASLLALNPAYQPDPLYVAPEIVAFVVEIRRALSPAPAAITAPAPLPFTAATAAGAMKHLEPETPFAWIDLVPFGAAQYRKGYWGRGLTLTLVESLSLGTNVGLYYYRRCSLKSSCSAHDYPAASVSRAQHLQTLQLAAGALFVTSAALGLVDGFTLPLSGPVSVAVRPSDGALMLAWNLE